MPATIWIGNIHFGTTSVPVKLHPAVSRDRIEFHLLHSTDRVRLRQQLVCALEKTPIPAGEQVKGFPLEERNYALLDPADLEQAEPESGREIEVREFVAAGAIDPVYRERAYFLEPGDAPAGYAALAAALRELKAEGICTWVMRKRAYLGALASSGRTLRLGVLRYADEVLPASSLGLEDFPLSEKELEIGSQLIARLSVPFRPQKYADEHREKLRRLLDRKARGEKIALLKPRHLRHTEGGRLLAALEESLKAAKK